MTWPLYNLQRYALQVKKTKPYDHLLVIIFISIKPALIGKLVKKNFLMTS